MNEQFNPATGTPNYDPNVNQGMNQGMMSQGMMNQNMNQGMMNQGMPNPGMMFDPATGQPMNMGNGGKKPGKKGLIIGLSIGAVVAVVAILVIVGILSGAFLSKRAKLAMAITNTFKDVPQIVKDLDTSEIIADNEYTIGIKADIEGERLDAELRNNETEKQISATVSTSTAGDIDFVIGIDEEKLSAYIPMLSSDVIEYNYKETKKGYIVDLVGRDSLDQIDSLLSLYSQDQTKLSMDIAAVVTDEFNSLEIRNTEKAEFEVGGATRRCGGYEFTITVDNLLHIVDGMEDAYTDYYGETAELLNLELEDLFDDMRDDIRDSGDLEVKIYIYKNKLAAIVMESDVEDVRILFKGEDNRLENIEVAYDDGYFEDTIVWEWTMETVGRKETFELYSDLLGETMSLEYDKRSGNFTFVNDDDYYGRTLIRGNLQKNRDNMVITIDKMAIYGTNVDAELEMTIRQGAEIEELKGDVFDIGNASQLELLGFLMGMEALF